MDEITAQVAEAAKKVKKELMVLLRQKGLKLSVTRKWEGRARAT